jgi:hypothetical protein
MDNHPSFEQAHDWRARRRETYDAIRHVLLSNRTEWGEPVRDETGGPYRLTDEGRLTERNLVQVLGKSRIPIREALTVLRTLGTISLRPEAKRYAVTLIRCDGTEDDNKLRENVAYELLNNGHSAISRFVESTSPDQRDQKLAPLRKKLDLAKKLATQNSNSVSTRAQAVLSVTDSLGDLATAARLHWAADAVRSGLDIIEISACHASPELTSASIADRIRDCEKIYDRIAQPSDDNDSTIEQASTEFETYVEHRLAHLQHECVARRDARDTLKIAV